MRKIGKWILIGFGALVVIGVIGSMANDDDAELAGASPSPSVEATASAEPEATDAAIASESEAPTPEPATPVPTPEPESEWAFEDGTHTVGSDIQPGTYRGEGGLFCYWERLSGFSGEFEDIANGTGDHGHVVTIADGDAGFSTDGCGGWTDDLSQVTDSDTGPFGDGTYIVGTDVVPGTYGAPGGNLCYWERLGGFSGEFGDIISNGTGESNQVVTIAESDAGFHTAGCGDWTQR